MLAWSCAEVATSSKAQHEGKTRCLRSLTFDHFCRTSLTSGIYSDAICWRLSQFGILQHALGKHFLLHILWRKSSWQMMHFHRKFMVQAVCGNWLFVGLYFRDLLFQSGMDWHSRCSLNPHWKFGTLRSRCLIEIDLRF